MIFQGCSSTDAPQKAKTCSPACAAYETCTDGTCTLNSGACNTNTDCTAALTPICTNNNCVAETANACLPGGAFCATLTPAKQCTGGTCVVWPRLVFTTKNNYSVIGSSPSETAKNFTSVSNADLACQAEYENINKAKNYPKNKAFRAVLATSERSIYERLKSAIKYPTRPIYDFDTYLTTPTPLLTTLTGWPTAAPTVSTACSAESTFECAITGSLKINQISSTTATPVQTTVWTGSAAANAADSTGFFTAAGLANAAVNTCTDWGVGGTGTATLAFINPTNIAKTWSSYGPASLCSAGYAKFLCIETDD